MSLFPGALASFAGFTATHTLAADSHAAQHNLEQGEILAVQTKVGTGGLTPTSGTVLRGTGAGASAWGQVGLTTDVTGVLPIANGGTGQATLTGLPLASPAITGVVPGGATYTTPILTTPTITDFTNATHNHQNATGAGTLNGATAIQPATITGDRLVADTVTPDKMLGVDVWNYSNAIVGSPPAAGSGQFYLQAGTDVVTTDGNGNGSFNYPTAFPNGVLSVIVCDGDTSSGAKTATVIQGSMTKSLCEIHSTILAGSARIDWIAIGF